MDEKDFDRLIKLLESLKDSVKYGKIITTGYEFNSTKDELTLKINIDNKGGH